MAKLIDTSSELLIRRWGHGIQLIKPEKQSASSIISNEIIGNVHDILNAPFSTYFLNTESIIQNINEYTISTCGFPSIKKTVGKTVYLAAKKETAEFTITHDREVVKTQRLIIKEEDFISAHSGLRFPAIIFKFPWYNHQNKLIGVMGFSIVLNVHSIKDSLQLIANTGLLISSSSTSSTILPGGKICGMYFSKREIECLHGIKQGMTAKMIAKKLLISPRTVENYIANIKTKLNVSSKSEMIDKVNNDIKKSEKK